MKRLFDDVIGDKLNKIETNRPDGTERHWRMKFEMKSVADTRSLPQVGPRLNNLLAPISDEDFSSSSRFLTAFSHRNERNVNLKGKRSSP